MYAKTSERTRQKTDTQPNEKPEPARLKMVIPKGRIYEDVVELLDETGLGIRADGRSYRPVCRDGGIDVKILKPRNIATLISMGTHDIGFCGRDWIRETDADVVVLKDLGFAPVRLVAAVPEGTDIEMLKKKRVVVATEYPGIAGRFCEEAGLSYYILPTNGATEVYPPDDADMIIDNVSTGETLRQNNLVVYSDIMSSSTCLAANRQVLRDTPKKQKIEEMLLLIDSVLCARERVMLEMNVAEDDLEGLIEVLPCLRSPTVSELRDGGYAVKAVVPKEGIARLIPRLRSAGARDILEMNINRVVI